MACEERGDLDETRIVIIGETGTGKSETGNSILHDPDAFRSEASAASVTKHCKLQTGKVCGKNVLVVDTPGLFDTETPNAEVILRIIQCILISSPGPHAILLTIRIDNRFSQQVKDTVAMFKKYFGEHANKYMIVVFTHKDGLTTRQGTKTIEDFVGEIEEANMIKILLHQCGMRYVAFNNKVGPNSAENKQQVQDLLDMIQNMVEENGGSQYTSEMLEAAERVMQQMATQLGSRDAARDIMVSPSWTDTLKGMLPELLETATALTMMFMLKNVDSSKIVPLLQQLFNSRNEPGGLLLELFLLYNPYDI